ncbi:unnamed protein product [Lampetra planeri]
MSKHLIKKNQPTLSSDDDGDLPPVVAIPDTEGAEGLAAGDAAGVQDVIAGASPSASPGAEDGWRLVAEQINSLQAVLLDLVTLVTPATALGQPRGGPLRGQASGGPGPSTIATSARLPVFLDTRQDAAILGAVMTDWREAATLSPPRGTAASAALVAEMDVEEPEEDLVVQEGRVDSPAAAISRARGRAEPQSVRAAAILSAGQEKALAKFDLPLTSRAYAQMAAIFNPPQKFATRRWRETEMLLTFHSALMSLAQAAYPKMEQSGELEEPEDKEPPQMCASLAGSLRGKSTRDSDRNGNCKGKPSLYHGGLPSPVSSVTCGATFPRDAVLSRDSSPRLCRLPPR